MTCSNSNKLCRVELGFECNIQLLTARLTSLSSPSVHDRELTWHLWTVIKRVLGRDRNVNRHSLWKQLGSICQNCKRSPPVTWQFHFQAFILNICRYGQHDTQYDLAVWGGWFEKGEIGKSLNVHQSGISKLTLANPYNELPSGCHKEQGQF